MELAYGPSAGQVNLARFDNREYDELFRQARRVKSDAERDKLYARMTEIIAAYAPIGGGIYRIENTITQPWVEGFKKSAFRQQAWRFLDLDPARQKSRK
jgi:ABC-type transport system substrate-binding protein